MDRALFTSVNLLGDTVCITPAIRAWSDAHPGTHIEVRVQDQGICDVITGNHPYGIVKRVPGNFELVRTPPDRGDYDFFFNFDITMAHQLAVAKNIHIIQAYGQTLGVTIKCPYPIINHITPTVIPLIKKPYICVCPFAGQITNTINRGHERAFSFRLWNNILNYLKSDEYQIAILGYPSSPWASFEKEVDAPLLTSSQVVFISEPSIISTLGYIASSRCLGFVGHNSGMMHCVSGLYKQHSNPSLTVLACMTSIVSPSIHHPTGIPNKNLVIRYDYGSKAVLGDIIRELSKFKSLIVSKLGN